MPAYSVEESVDANAEDILDFLESAVRFIHPDKQPHEQLERMERTIHFLGERKGNTVSIYVKAHESDGHREEIIRFEVIRRSENISVIKAFYECNNSHIALMFYKIWSRLGVGFGASFARKALRKMRDLK